MEFDNFKQSFSYLQSAAEFAEQIDHHPEIFNVYNRVEILLRTHDCDGISVKDMFLARYMDMIEDKVRSENPDKIRTFKIY